MEKEVKEKLLSEARDHLSTVRTAIGGHIRQLDQTLELDYAAYREITGETEYEDKLRAVAIGRNTGQIREQLIRLETSPYFARCDITLGDDPTKSYYFAKFPASEHGIYSWTAPFASIRFEDPGEVSYIRPDGKTAYGHLSRRDQFMVTNGQLRFMTSESGDYQRELIYQEHFSTRKDGFMLPEIVSQMERAQDQIIRAHHAGPFVISGPAGSGKTTLALHRIAYLRQAPETEPLYPAHEILVLVQDSRTQDYFSRLLPELGINDVSITTFAQWALGLLELKNYVHRIRAGETEDEQDSYEVAKILAAQRPLRHRFEPKRLAEFLRATYSPFMNDSQRHLLDEDLSEHALDRHDLTLLLRATQEQNGKLTHNVEHVKFLPGGKVRTTYKREPLRYSLVLVDEFQNYLPTQLQLLKDAAALRHRSVIYVGDLAQQTQFGTIRDWSDIKEAIQPDRAITLSKVYRNTSQILRYIRSLGFDIEIPVGVAEGPEVQEVDIVSVAEGVEYIKQLPRPAGSTIGVLAKDGAALKKYIRALSQIPEIQCLTIREAQGVEFDAVCLIQIDSETFKATSTNDRIATERQRINRDILYVALTRAISSLHIMGSGNISKHLHQATQST